MTLEGKIFSTTVRTEELADFERKISGGIPATGGRQLRNPFYCGEEKKKGGIPAQPSLEDVFLYTYRE